MKCFIVIVGVLALLAMSQAQSEESENTTVEPSESGEVNNSPAPPPKRIPGPRRPLIGGFVPGFSFGLGSRGKQPGQQQQPGEENPDANSNPPRRFPLQRQPVLFDFGSRNNFGLGNFFSDDPTSNTPGIF